MGIDTYTINRYRAGRKAPDTDDGDGASQDQPQEVRPSDVQQTDSEDGRQTEAAPRQGDISGGQGGDAGAAGAQGPVAPEIPRFEDSGNQYREQYLDALKGANDAKEKTLSDYVSYLEEERRREEERGKKDSRIDSTAGALMGIGEALSALAALRGTIKGAPMAKVGLRSSDWMRQAEEERKGREAKLSGLRERQMEARAKQGEAKAAGDAAMAKARYDDYAAGAAAKWKAAKDTFDMGIAAGKLGVEAANANTSAYNAETERNYKQAKAASEAKEASARAKASEASAEASRALADQRRKAGGGGASGSTVNLVVDGDTYHYRNEKSIADNLSQHRDEIAADLTEDELEEYTNDMEDAAAAGPTAVMDVLSRWAQRSPAMKGILKQAADGVTAGSGGAPSAPAGGSGAGSGEMINGIEML